MDDIYRNNEEHNPNKKQKILIVFDDMSYLLLEKIKLFSCIRLNYVLD